LVAVADNARTYTSSRQLTASWRFINGKQTRLLRNTGTEQVGDADEVKRAYRKLAMQHHPDKHAAMTPSSRKSARRMRHSRTRRNGRIRPVRPRARRAIHSARRAPAVRATAAATVRGGAAGFEGFDFSDILNQFMGGAGAAELSAGRLKVATSRCADHRLYGRREGR